MPVVTETVAKGKLNEINKIVFECTQQDEGCLYAFYVYHDDKIIEKAPYTEQNKFYFWASLPGDYYAAVFIKEPSGTKRKVFTNHVSFSPEQVTDFSDDNTQKITLWDSVEIISREFVHNFSMTFRLATYDYRLENQDTYLGKVWGFLTPLIQIGTYWFVFGVGLRQGRDVNGIPFVVWMLCGLIPWFFINQGIVKGANSIYAKINSLSRMKFPMSTLPLERILMELYEHGVMLLLMIVMLLVFGYYPSLFWLNLLYYILYEVIFLTSLALVTSVFTMIARDFQKLLQSLIRLLFYITPILWDMSSMPELFQKIMEFNPIYYVVIGFRESLLYQTPFWQSPAKIAFFWGLNVLLYFLGSFLQVKVRNQFVDLG